MRFPYGEYEVEASPSQPGITVVYRPVIPLRLVGPAGSALAYGLLDTGADETVLPQELADLIGMSVKPSASSTVLGASGELPADYGAVTMQFTHGNASYQWRATVAVVQQPWREALLGHIGFLRYFDVTFLGGQRAVRLKRNAVPLPG